MATTYEYPVEDMGEFARAEFGATATFVMSEDFQGQDYAVVKHVEFYEWVDMPTRGTDGVIRSRFIKAPRDCPTWFASLVERRYQEDMLGVFYRVLDGVDTAASRADDYRDELINREMRG
jgi:hypothetical protein